MAGTLMNEDDFGKVLDRDVSPKDDTVMADDSLALLLDDAPTMGSSRQADLATQNAMIQGKAIDLQVINLAAADSDGTAALSVAASKLYAQLDAEITATGKSFNEISPNDAPAVLQQMVTAQEQVQKFRLSPVAAELAVIRGATNVPLKEAVQLELAFNLAAHNELSKIADQAGILDTITNIAGNFVPFRHANDYSDLLAGIKEHPELKGALDPDSIGTMISSWQSLPTARKQALIKPLVEAILAATGVNYGIGKSDSNMLNAAGILIRFLQPEGAERAELESNIMLGVDVASILPFGALAKGARAVKLMGTTAKQSAAAGKRIADIYKLKPALKKDMMGIMGNAADYLRRVNNPVKVVAKAGDLDQAARMNLAAMMDDGVAKAYGLPSDGAYKNAMPMRATTGTPEFVEGLSPATARTINKYKSQQQGFRQSMTSESDLLQLGVIGKSERTTVVRNFYSDMELKAEDLLQEGIALKDVRVIEGSINEAGFTYEFVLENVKHMELVAEGKLLNLKPKTHTAFRSWRVNEVTGNFEESVVAGAKPGLSGRSPAAWSVTGKNGELDFNDAVKQSIALEDVSVTNKQLLNEQWLEANKTISHLGDIKARARVESIELAGDEFINKGSQVRGKVFTERELIAGVHTKDGIVRLTKQNEVEAYYLRRQFADTLWNIQNYITRRELQIGGFNGSVTLKGGGLAVKPFESSVAAKMSVGQRPGRNVYLSHTDDIKPLTDELIDAQYAEGKILVRSRNDWNTTGAGDLARGGEVVEYIFLEQKVIKNLPDQVLHYKNGYVPKINEGIEYVVKQKMPINKAGVKGATRDTALRAFASKQDADLFKQQQVAKLLAKKPEANESEIAAINSMFEVADGSKMAQMERMENALSGTGGLYTGTRSADDLLMGLNGVPIERMAPGEAFGRYIDHLGTAVTRNEWRIGQEAQWLNTVRKMDNGIEVKGFNGTNLPATAEGKALESQRRQINTWNRVPSREESMFEGMMQKFHDWTLNKARGMGLDKNAINSILWLKHSDPVSAMLTANMHIMLGAMSPAQLYVQASAAVVAMSLVQVKDIPGIIADTARFTMLDNIKNPVAYEKAMTKLINGKQVLKEQSEMYQGWRRSGLYDSVRSNADMNYVSSTGIGITNDLMRKGSNASLLFYRAGELTNRRISYISAYTRWKRANPGKVLDNDELLSVVQESNKTMLELNSANKAWWQGGAGTSAPQRLFSITGQFQQVLAKTVELAIKGEKRGGFSNGQKRRIAVGQTLMFGGAGMPLLNVVMPAISDWLGVEPDSSVANGFNQGLVGVVVKEVFGANIEISNRAALFSSTFETGRDIITSKDPMWTKLLAVSGSSGQRIGEMIMQGNMIMQSQAFSRLAELEPLLMHDRSGESIMQEPTMLETARDIAVLMASIPSSGRGIMKAMMMHNAGKILDRRGRVVIDTSDKDGFTFADKLGVALGFGLTRETRVRAVQQHNRDTDVMVNAAAQTIVAAYHRYVYTHDMNPKYAQSVHNVVQLIHESIDNPLLVERVMSRVESSIFSDAKSVEEREMLKFFETIVPEKLTEGVLLDTSINFGNVFNKQTFVQPFQGTLERGNK